MEESNGNLPSDSYDDDTMSILLEIMPKYVAHGELLGKLGVIIRFVLLIYDVIMCVLMNL